MRRKWLTVGILVFLELLVCAGILGVAWTGRATLKSVRFFYVTDTHVEETVERTFAVDGPAVLEVTNDFGDVVVTGSDESEVEVIATLSLWGTDEEDARRRVDVQMNQMGDRVTVRVIRPEYLYAFAFFDQGSRVDFEVRVPAETSLHLVTDSGDLTVSDVVGAVDLDTDFGSIKAERVDGPVSASSDSGDITLVDLDNGGNMEVENDFGGLVLRGIVAESLTAHSDGGEIQVEDVTLEGTLELGTDFGSVSVRNAIADHLIARSDSGGIEVEGATLDGGLDLATSFGSVTAIGVRAASYRLASDSGDLTLDECSGPLDLQTEFGDVEVTSGSKAVLMLKTESGSITFAGDLGAEGDHLVESGFGPVHLILPADAAFDLDAETDFGSIKSDFAVMMIEFEEKHMVGKVNGGGPLLQIYTDGGDITLESVAGEHE